MTPKRIWQGSPALQRSLVEIAALEPFPGNPRRGVVDELRASLRRFGQVLPVLADPALGDGDRLRIIARHHLVQAAAEEGWTHVAVVQHEFASEDEARAYLVADNRLGQIGGMDEEALDSQLAALRGAYEGTGFTESDHRELAARLAALRNPVFPEASEDDVPSLDSRSPTTGVFEVPLRLAGDVRRDFAQHIHLLEREWGVSGVSEVVVRAVREAAAAT